MIRLTLLSVAISFLALYAWKDWYRALCGLIVLMAFLEHRDMPRTMFGIPGFNPWNFLLFAILAAWMMQRRRERLRWDMPRHLAFLLLLYLGVVLIGFARLMADPHGLHTGTAGLVSDYLVNPVKYAVPGVLIFDGCRSRERLVWAMGALVLLYLLLGMQVIRWMPPQSALSEEFASRAQRVLRREIGYHRVTLSVMLAGASWAILVICPLARNRMRKLLIVGASLVVLLAQILTGGRGGYLALVVAGVILGLLRWPKYLLLAPVAALALVTLLPGVVNRALEGFAGEHGGAETVDIDRLTAGRNVFWPIVAAKISESPIIGHGRATIQRTTLREQLDQIGEPINNPHSAYLELLLDSGWLGLLVILAFYVSVVVLALRLLRDRRSPIFAAVGGAGAAFLITFLVGSITGESFYPREGTLGMWCAIGLLIRVWVERARVRPPYSRFARNAKAPASPPGATLAGR
jgi:O-antigen ligase